MASTSVQSRVSEFEARRHNKYAPSTTSSTSLLEAPLSPTASSLKPIVPQPSPPRLHESPSASPPSVHRYPSLADLRDWVVDDGPGESGAQLTSTGSLRTPTPTQHKFGNGTHPSRSAPLINLDSPPKLKTSRGDSKLPSESANPPPLPPRKPSYTSLKDAASLKSSNSLTVDPPHTYPPSPKLHLMANANHNSTANGNGTLRIGLGHAPASSISSFHSVSLSSDGGTDHDPGTPASLSSNHIASYPMDRPDFPSAIHDDVTGSSTSSRPMTSINGSEADAISLDESFENVSSTSLGSPATNAIISMDWERALAKNMFPYAPRSPAPPKLPQRPASAASKTSFAPSILSHPMSAPMSPKARPISSASSYSSGSAGSSLTTVPSTSRRKPPPLPPSSYPSPPMSQPSSPPLPPPRPGSSRISFTSNSASDRSSILSVSTNTSRSSFIAMQVDSQSGSKTNLPVPRGQTQSPRMNAAVLRPTPVPMAARTRYEAVFKANVDQARRAERETRKKGKQRVDDDGRPGDHKSTKTRSKRTRQAAGWRGLSVDLITGVMDEPSGNTREEDDSDDEVLANRARRARQAKQALEDDEWEDLAGVASPEKLDGSVVRLIWNKSRLDRDCLKGIWLECDPIGSGSLTRDAFVRGMWRIDEELRRARIRSSTSSTAASLRSWSNRMGSGEPSASGAAWKPPPPPKPKAILR